MAVVDPSQQQWGASVARFTVLRAAIRELRYGPTVDGPVITTVERGNDRMAAQVQGRLTEEGGCLLVGGTPVFWLFGTRWDAAHRTVVSRNRARTTVGEWFDGGGGYYDVGTVGFTVEPAGAERLERCARLAGTTQVTLAHHPGD